MINDVECRYCDIKDKKINELNKKIKDLEEASQLILQENQKLKESSKNRWRFP